VARSGDCNDNAAAVNPGAAEVPYDGVDNDCDAATRDDDLDRDGVNRSEDCDDADAAVGRASTRYRDADGDSWGAGAGATLCPSVAGHVARSGDCNDDAAAVNPGAAEVPYDGVDNDCDAATRDDDLDGDGLFGAADCDDTDPSVGGRVGRFADEDGDGWGAGEPVSVCPEEAGYADRAGDCADQAAAVNPGAVEVPYDGVDNDCDAATRDDDLDGDGLFGAADCDDTDPSVGGRVGRFADEDGDGWGAGEPVSVCPEEAGYADRAGDCADQAAAVNPGAVDVPDDDVDQDCDGADDTGADDSDSDTGLTESDSVPEETDTSDTSEVDSDTGEIADTQEDSDTSAPDDSDSDSDAPDPETPPGRACGCASAAGGSGGSALLFLAMLAVRGRRRGAA
jgi:F0F1-type ATP synthase epsilon subunit